MTPGTYSYRFSGHTMKNHTEYHLVGVGAIELARNGTAKGFHTSTITPLEGSAAMEARRFSVAGRIAKRRSGFGPNDLEARVTFTSEDTDEKGDPIQILDGCFSLVTAQVEDTKWLISTAHNNKTQEKRATEQERGEIGKIH